MKRCAWARGSELSVEYHDVEWGVPCREDHHLFEMLILEGAQAGLSWSTILNKRAGYRRAYRGFDPAQVARFSTRKRQQLIEDPGIVRNRLKVEASVANAKAFLELQSEFPSFAEFCWSFVAGEPIQNRWRAHREIPAETRVSRDLSEALRARGFRFVGPTICYAFMQAIGMVNDHELSCFRHAELTR